MNSLKSLAALVGGVIVIAVLYGIAFGGKDAKVSFEFDDGDGVRHIVSGDRGDFMLRDGDFALEASWRGDYELSANGSDIARLDRKLEIKRTDGGVSERAVFENDNGEVDRIFYRDGEKQEPGAGSDEAVRALVLAFLRASGVKADERVEILMKDGGADRVLDEIDLLQGDHARQRYISTFTERAALTSDQLRRLAGVISGMEGDHDIRLAISAILENETVSTDDLPLIIETARNIEGDYDLRRVIETFAEQDLNEEAIELALGLFDEIDGDHDLRKAGEAILKQKSLTADGAALLLSVAAEHVSGDHDMRLLLTDAAPFLAKSDQVVDAWLKAFDSIGSDHDMRVALEAASTVADLSDAAVAKLINATRRIGSDYDHRRALAAFVDRAKENPDLVAAYRASAEEIGSDHDRDGAFKAIGETGGD
jgi:uncharacterized protein (DUF779 family)